MLPPRQHHITISAHPYSPSIWKSLQTKLRPSLWSILCYQQLYLLSIINILDLYFRFPFMHYIWYYLPIYIIIIIVVNYRWIIKIFASSTLFHSTLHTSYIPS